MVQIVKHRPLFIRVRLTQQFGYIPDVYKRQMYFIAIRLQKKQQKKQQSLVNSLEVGDSVLTTSGFYGVVIDITEDTVIVEFGNNKNCRIPMQKSAITDVEKANAE